MEGQDSSARPKGRRRADSGVRIDTRPSKSSFMSVLIAVEEGPVSAPVRDASPSSSTSDNSPKIVSQSGTPRSRISRRALSSDRVLPRVLEDSGQSKEVDVATDSDTTQSSSSPEQTESPVEGKFAAIVTESRKSTTVASGLGF